MQYQCRKCGQWKHWRHFPPNPRLLWCNECLMKPQTDNWQFGCWLLLMLVFAIVTACVYNVGRFGGMW